MSNISHTEINLSELKNNIENDVYKIPKFQRDFIWNRPSIESLGDSIIRGYPISSILTMPVNGSLQITADSLKVNRSEFNSISNSNPFYVLDGQQRITSIARIFCNLDQDYQYFFDCLAILLDQFPDDGLERLTICKNSQKQYSKMEYLCLGIKVGVNKSFIDQKESFRFIAAHQIINGKFVNLINKFIRTIENEISEDYAEKYINHLGFCFGKISQYGISQTIIEANADLGVVCRVFEKINASGRKLTIFDLINAKSFDYNGYPTGLSNYLRVDLNKTDDHTKEALKFYFEYKNDFENLARIIRILILIEQLENDKTPQFINSVILKKPSKFWFDMWDQYKKTIIDCLRFFYHDGILKISPLSYFEYMIAVICANQKIKYNSEFNAVIKKYALSLSINGRSFSKSDLDTVVTFNRFAKEIINNPYKNVYTLNSNPYTNINIDRNLLKSSAPTSNRFKAAYYIMVNEQFEKKFITDIKNSNIKSINSNIYPHYIIPKSSTKNNKNTIFNSIANVIPLVGEGNQDKLKDKMPDVYFKELRYQYKDKFDILLCQNLLIESDEYDIDFLEKRFEDISDYVQRYFNHN